MIAASQFCGKRSTLQRVVVSLSGLQKELRLDWKLSSITHLDGYSFPKSGCDPSFGSWVLSNPCGSPTVIPTYLTTLATWEAAMLPDPLTVDWMLFDASIPEDVNYLSILVEILSDMQELWINDENTKEHSTMVLFAHYTMTVKRLFVLISNYYV